MGAAGKGSRPRPWPLGPQTAQGGPSIRACPYPTPKRVRCFEEPVAPGVQCRHLSARTAGLWSHTVGRGALRVGQHLPPTAGPGAGALLGQDKAPPAPRESVLGP